VLVPVESANALVRVSLPGGQAPPPQSTSVSLPFLLVSWQLAGGSAQMPLEQKPLLQSLRSKQAWFVAQDLQLPPQSMSVSLPLCKPSLQLAAAHALSLQMPLLQSPALPHTKPLAQLGQPPPQSTSLSVPFRRWSLQLAGGAAHTPLEHSPLSQS